MADNKMKWQISDEEKERYIDALTQELPILRAKVGVPQDELARIIGVSRQTYGSIERKERRMSWNTYLSLVFFFDYNKATHKMIRALSAFPEELIDRMNDGEKLLDLERIAGITEERLEAVLDDRALHAIRSLIMVEYARCSNLPGEAVVKSFDGKNLAVGSSKRDGAVQKALKNIRRNGLV